MERDLRKASGENILIIDDTLENLQNLSATLAQNGYTVQAVISASMALTVAQLARPDLILLDIKMPGIDSYEVCQIFKESKKTCDIPIIFLSSLHDVSQKIKAFNLGCADYITKPFQVEEVLARVQYQLTIQRLYRQIKQQNQQLEDEIAQRRKVEEKAVAASIAKSNFLANMSHELRTPLNAIIGFSQLMSNDLLNAEQQENIQIINRSAVNLLELINDILELSKIEAGVISLDKTSFDLYGLLDNIAEMFQITVKQKNINLNFIVAPELPQYIQTDAKKLRSCLSNLIGNAMIAIAMREHQENESPPQGNITLQVSLVETESPHLLFQIEDNGCGISEHELEKLFDAFSQAQVGKKSLQGTGLGLAITRKFVQTMGGEITVKSTLGEGSVFTFDIKIDVIKNDRVDRTSSLVGNYKSDILLEELMTMPQTWLSDLNQAANEVNEDLLQKLVEEIPSHKASLSQYLTELLKDFRLDIIIEFMQKIMVVDVRRE
ncbi:hybrid sensor histidine kinase/response regulator [Rivularia sp. UHCC 0363]|uniref:hybrid sensor histidine kinase/response regulator n=1 Tax=Rivularia sp. UHCC 0363 TaxID=3110244 RepID=UPI002B211BF4|nr:ATP-binding protein [Rivularia sp. UHCC 0363]MEA5595095.1 ATP-binding protein [Rivularia sp. UHCC 0363]